MLEREWDELLNFFQVGGVGPHHPVSVTAQRSQDLIQFCARFPASRNNVPTVSVVDTNSLCGTHDVKTTRHGFSRSYTGLSYELDIPIQILPVNDAPRWTYPRIVTGGLENTVMHISGVSVHDDDSVVLGEDNLVLRLTLTSQYGRIRIPLQGDEDYSSSLVLNDTVANLNRALTQMTYLPNDNFNTYKNDFDTIELVAGDMGSFGEGDPLSGEATIRVISIDGTNDAPVVIFDGMSVVEYPCDASLDSFAESRHVPSLTDGRCGTLIEIPPLYAHEDVMMHITTIHIEDADADELVDESYLTLNLSSRHGVLSIAVRDFSCSTFSLYFSLSLCFFAP